MAKSPALGLLIRDLTVEVLELAATDGKFQVTSYAWLKLPAGLVQGGRVVKPKELAEELKKVLALGKPKPMKGPVVLGLVQSQVFLKVLTVPQFEEKEMEEAISWHIGSLGPVLPQKSYKAFEMIGKGVNNEIRVLLAAVSQEVADSYLEATELAGIEVLAVEPLAMAKARLVDPKKLTGKSVVSVHLYGEMLAVSVLVNGKLWFSREMRVTGEGLEIRTAVMELTKFFAARKEMGVVGVSEVVVSGDRKGISLAEKNLAGLKLPVNKAEPGVMLKESTAVNDVAAVVFAPVLGLAMRARMHQRGLINLLPEWPKEKAKLSKLAEGLSRLVVGIGVGVWFLVVLLGWWQFSLKDQRKDLVLKADRLEQREVSEEEKELRSWGQDFNQTVRAAEAIESRRVSLAEGLSQLASLTPTGVKITGFRYEAIGERWSMSGVAEKREQVLLFDQVLKESEWFSEASLYFSSLDSEVGVVFRFSGGRDE